MSLLFLISSIVGSTPIPLRQYASGLCFMARESSPTCAALACACVSCVSVGACRHSKVNAIGDMQCGKLLESINDTINCWRWQEMVFRASTYLHRPLCHLQY
ncbi:hypothetical protein GGR51DRAFT_495762 [Nemania sp. FL0031]|nr:hypothetical protein GGR51DRAFT_495762 [Nemania sp. FL0031]